MSASISLPQRAPVFAFECNVTGTNWQSVINARTAGQAKSEYWRRVTEPWPSVPYTAIRVRKLGAPQSSEAFVRNAEYRRIADWRCGDRVIVCGKARGVIVGHNSSANLDVLFDADSPLYPNVVGNCHPAKCVREVAGADPAVVTKGGGHHELTTRGANSSPLLPDQDKETR